MVIAGLVGVVEDGATRPGNLPYDERRTLRVSKGANVTIQFTVYDASGQPHDLTTDTQTVAFTVKAKPTDDEAVLSIAATVNAARGRGCVDVAVTPAMLRDVDPATLFWDLWLTRVAAGPVTTRDQVVRPSPFIVADTVASVP